MIRLARYDGIVVSGANIPRPFGMTPHGSLINIGVQGCIYRLSARASDFCSGGAY